MIRSPFTFRRSQQSTSFASRGFTLIELLVVIAIIGLLSGISFYSVAEARVKATNARVLTQVRGVVNLIESYKSSTGEYPLTSGIVCLGGTDCGTDSSATLNAELEKATATSDTNPMKKKVAFNTDGDERFRAWYARCSDVSGYCEDDDIAEIVWYLEGSKADCGSGASKFVSDAEGNTACVYKLSGIGTVINQAALGFNTIEPTTCTDVGACNYGSAGSCDYSCIAQCTDAGACNYGAAASCDYSCLCGDATACNYSGNNNGGYAVCDYSCQSTCSDTSACNYGSMGSCNYNCCQDSNACNYRDVNNPSCDYSCRGNPCSDPTACNYGSYAMCDYSCNTYCTDWSACNYGANAACEYLSCKTCWDTLACNYGAPGNCEYSSCKTCWDTLACNYGAPGNCEYTSCSSTCTDTSACNWGAAASCEYTSCYCNDGGACNNGARASCDYSCYQQCYETGACNYGAYGPCDWSCY